MKKIIFLLSVFSLSHAFGNKLYDAYSALDSYDYFKAKKLFYGCLKKQPSEAAYGLATIFSRNDNPFHHTDSAAKYIAICHLYYKDTSTYFSYHLNPKNNKALAETISLKGFEKYCITSSVADLNHFLTYYYFTNDSIINRVFYLRDDKLLNYYATYESSDSMQLFLLAHPESQLYQRAQQLFYNFQYFEQTKDNEADQFKRFIKHYPSNPCVKAAELKLFELTKQLHINDSLYAFIKHYSKTNTREEAWKLLYSNSVKNYHEKELNDFIHRYPDYPYSLTLLKEISLSQKILLPCKYDDATFGYIDTLGHWAIKPTYDDAEFFSEGFAAVCKNDSCFYISKEGIKASPFYYDETESYLNGIAIVKKENTNFLINRSGQFITKGYDDINELSDNLYVCKQNSMYGAINSKGQTVIPFTYTKLGNFKNGYAYYMSNQYGLVDVNNNALKAQWDWVSDVDSNSLVTVKRNGKFGLMTLHERILLNPEYDFITMAQNGIYMVVKNDLYGFYNAYESCFATAIDYDYQKGLETSYYTNGKQFKLLQDDKVALIDANGRYSITFGTYNNLFFAKCDLIRIQKNGKYGYVDRKLKLVIPTEYEDATDFENDVALVLKKGSHSLINKEGKTLFSTKGEIEKITSFVYQITDANLSGLVSIRGEMLLPNEYNDIKGLNEFLFRCQKNNDLFLYNIRTKVLSKIPTL